MGSGARRATQGIRARAQRSCAIVLAGICLVAGCSQTTTPPAAEQWRRDAAASLLAQLELGGPYPQITALLPTVSVLSTASVVWLTTFTTGSPPALDDATSRAFWADVTTSVNHAADTTSPDPADETRAQAASDVGAAARLVAATDTRYRNDAVTLYRSYFDVGRSTPIGRVRLRELRRAALRAGADPTDLVDVDADHTASDCALLRSMIAGTGDAPDENQLLALAVVARAAGDRTTCPLDEPTWVRTSALVAHAFTGAGRVTDPGALSQLVTLEAAYGGPADADTTAAHLTATAVALTAQQAQHPPTSPGHLGELAGPVQAVTEAIEGCACGNGAAIAIRTAISNDVAKVAQRALTLGGRLSDGGTGDPADAIYAIAALDLLHDTASSADDIGRFTHAVHDPTDLSAIGDLAPSTQATVLLALDSDASHHGQGDAVAHQLVALLTSGPGATRRAPLLLATLARRYGLDLCATVGADLDAVIASLRGDPPTSAAPGAPTPPPPLAASVAPLTDALSACAPTLAPWADQVRTDAVTELTSEPAADAVSVEQITWLAQALCDAQVHVDGDRLDRLAARTRTEASAGGVAIPSTTYVALTSAQLHDPCRAGRWWEGIATT